jgi:hypothetical protein
VDNFREQASDAPRRATLNDASLENLAVAVITARDASGMMQKLRLKDVLQDWVLRQYPEFVLNPISILTLTKEKESK